MSLAHGLILGLGSLLVGIPILLHLLMQPKPKHFAFPALRFVRQMHRTNQRSLQLRHWLLLALRCLLILALVAAFARPSTSSAAFGDWLSVGGGGLLSLLTGLLLLYALVWSKPANIPLAMVVGAVFALTISYTGYMVVAAFSKDTGRILADQQAPVAVVLLVDSSPRMAYRFENQRILDVATQQGRWIVNQLPPGSRVSVLTTNGDQPFYSVDVSAARRRLETLDIHHASTSLPAAMSSAVDFISESELERKEIYVVTDLTQPAWLDADSRLAEQLAEQTDIDVYLVDVGVEQPANLSLAPLELSATSLASRSDLEIETRVVSQNVDQSVVVKLKLEKPDLSRPRRVDGQTLLPEDHITRPGSLELGKNQSAAVSFSLPVDLPEGIHHGWVEIDAGDSLSIDDRRYFTIEIQPQWNVLVAHGPDVDPANLVEAIDPQVNDNGEIGLFDCDVITTDQMPPPELEQYRVIFLLNPDQISDSLWALLERYVSGGGNLAIFLGHQAASGNEPKPDFRSAAAANVLPGSLLRIWRRSEGDLSIQMDQMAHPALKRFRPLASLSVWQPFSVFRHWEFEGLDSNSQVVLRFSNGMPAVIERRVGDGKVICMTTPITEPTRPEGRTTWNHLFISVPEPWPAWMLVTEISKYLASASRDQLNLQVGQTAVLQNDADRHPLQYRLFSPRGGEPERIRPSKNTIRYGFTDMPGNYRLKGELDGPVLRGFSVNLPAGATDLQRIESEQLNALLGDDRYQLGRDREEIRRQQGATRMGQEFYPILALMLGLFLALETIMANRFYRKAA